MGEVIEITNFRAFIHELKRHLDISKTIAICNDYIYRERKKYVFLKEDERISLFCGFITNTLKLLKSSELEYIIHEIDRYLLGEDEITIERMLFILFNKEIYSLWKKKQKGLIDKKVYEAQMQKFNDGNYHLQELLSLIESEWGRAEFQGKT